MGIFKKNQPREILFLMPVHLESEKLSRGKIRMLYCDADGKVYTTMLSRTVYQQARDAADEMERAQKSFAVTGQETDRGDFLPAAVEIDSEEEQAMQYILEHALKSGMIPDILKKYDKELWNQIGPEIKANYRLQKLGKMFPHLIDNLMEKAAKDEKFRLKLESMLPYTGGRDDMGKEEFLSEIGAENIKEI